MLRKWIEAQKIVGSRSLYYFCFHFADIFFISRWWTWIIVSFRYICQVTWMIILFNLIRLPKLDPCVSTIKILTKNANSCLTQVILFWCFLTDTYINDSKPPFPNFIYIYIYMLNHTKVTLFVSNCLRKFSFLKKSAKYSINFYITNKHI